MQISGSATTCLLSYRVCLLNLFQGVDGWELNQQFFPSPEDHPKPLNQRYQEFYGQQKVKEVLESSQNAGLIQYRQPGRGKGFSFTVRYPRNPTPCNILLEGKADVYMLCNYRKHVNCSLTTLYPASVKVLSLNVCLQDVEVETGTVHKCQKRGLPVRRALTLHM